MAQSSLNQPPLRSNNILTWVFGSALAVTVLFVSFALFFSRSLATDFNNEQIPTQAEVSNSVPELSAASIVISTDPNPGILDDDADFSSPASVIGTQGSITPVASSTLTAYVHILARDGNGWQDIAATSLLPGSAAYGGYIEDNAGPQCLGTNDYDCYADIVNFTNCDLVATSTHVIQLRCPVDLSYYTKPSSNWTLSVDVFDRTGQGDSEQTTFTINSLLAYNIDLAALDFGAVTVPVATLDNSNKEVRFANSGNVDIADLQVDHTDMACVVGGVTPSGTINYDGLAYSTSTLGSLWDFAVTGTLVGTDFAFPVPAETAGSGYQSKLLYNHLRHVNSGTSGSCTGSITFTPNS